MNETAPVPDVALHVAERLRTLSGVAAVVLGGSVARGDADARSDVDLGLYYDPARPFAIPALREVARELDDRHQADLVTDFGGWGPWINGGGWLVIGGTRVDWLYRDLTKVGVVVADCLDGRYATYYQPGHPTRFTRTCTWPRSTTGACWSIARAASPRCRRARCPIRPGCERP